MVDTTNNSDYAFKLKLSLEKLSSVAVAIWFWELPAVKEKVNNHLVKYKDWNDYAIDDWDNVISYIVNQAHFHFPKKLLCTVKNFIQILGVKLYNWLRYVIDVLKLNLKYTKKIYWTSNGEIDELKIVKEYWLRNGEEELGVIQHNCFLKKPLFCTAAAYVQEDFIHSHFEEIKNDIFQYLLVSHRKMDWSIYAIVATWISFCQHKTKTAAVRYFRSFNTLPELPAGELFPMCVKSGFKYAVQYFFDKFEGNEAEKQNQLMKAAFDCLELYKEKTSCLYERERYIEILIFLIIKMDDTKRLQFITQNFVFLFKKFLYMWPYQEICLNLLRNDPDYLPGIHDKLLKKIIKGFCSTFYKVKYFGKGITYNQIFQTLLEKVPAEVKKNIFTEENYTVLKSLKMFNYDILTLIFNDSALKDYRDNIMAVFEYHLQELILKGSYDDVSELMKFYSYEEQILVKQGLNFLTNFLSTGNIKLAEQNLNWLCGNKCEKLAMKKQIDPITVCTNLIKKSRYDLTSEYLNWQCNNEEEQKTIKETMISNGTLCDQVYQIWCMHKSPGPQLLIADVRRECEELLYWFLKDDEAVIKFRENELVKNESFIEKYWNNLFYHSSFDCLDDFLKFCFWSPEKIEDLRQKITKNAEWWIDTYAVERNNFLMVHSLFKWVFKNEKEMENIILRYMVTPKGASLILKSFKNSNSRSGILHLFNTWLRPYDPVYIAKIKLNLDAYNNNVVRESTISVLKNLLNEVQIGNYISAKDVSRKNFEKS